MTNSIEIKGVVWDWNGTLLDDLEYSCQVINVMLEERGLLPLSLERYKDIFTFPVKKYYEEAGFDFGRESWAEVGAEFMEHYWKNFFKVKLFKDVPNALETLGALGLPQSVLSAMHEESLEETLTTHRIRQYFENIYGISHNYADGKLESGQALVLESDLDPENLLLIGDTLHDAAVARELGMQCVLVTRGHQTEERLEKAGVPLFSSLTDVMSWCQNGQKR